MMPENNQDISKSSAPKANKENTLPNVILITLDAFNYELFAKNLEILPNMKELKNKCVFFENAFSIGPATFFSFPGIIGGVYPYHFGVGINKNIKAIDDILKDYGYNTAVINESNALLTPFFGYGKNIDYQKHFLDLSNVDVDRRLEDTFLKGGDNKIPRDHLKQARIIERFYKRLNNKWIKNYGKYIFNIFKFLKLYLIDTTENFKERKKLYDAFRNEILDFIDKRFERPQFLWIHTIVNHLPYSPPENSDKFSVNEVNYLNYRGLSGLVNHRICEKLKLLYIESMKSTDKLIGDIIDALRINNLLDDTILVITADHGEEFMEEGYFGHAPESSSDRLLNVPLMFYCPNMLKHKSISVPVSTIDILPTISDLLGLRMPNSNRGISLKEILLDMPEDSKEYQKFWQRPIYSEAWDTEGLLDRNPGYKSDKKIFTVRKGQYKLKIIQERKNENTIMEKFDLVNWINNEKLDIKSNNQIFEELRHMLYHHIYIEGGFARYIRNKSEKQRIKKALSKIKDKA